MLSNDTESHPGNNTVHTLGIMGAATPGDRIYHILKTGHINDNGIHEMRKINYQIGPRSVYQQSQFTISSGVSRNKLRGVLRFPKKTFNSRGLGGTCPLENFDKN